jgi:3-oxoacyl-[acyl-carrier protein] reductase
MSPTHINISSIASLSPPPTASVYSATKGAVDAITKSLAQELGPKKIFVNSVLPGATQTEGVDAMANTKDLLAHFVAQTPLGRIGQPNDIAGIVSFLASGDAGWITGQMIGVSGGLR